MTLMERLQEKLPDASSEKLACLLEDAKGFILAYTGLGEVPAALQTAQVQLAVIYYNREGIEGESAHSEGGVSRTLPEIPQGIAAQLRPWRAARCAAPFSEGADV